jgi:long-subunit acyl-CoA synthetase (AMP-forming)
LVSGRAGGATRGVFARSFGAKLRKSAGLWQVRDFLAGAAPVPAALHAWCEAAGLPLRIVYGQTELTGATSISPRFSASFGAVGLPLDGVAVRLSSEGELLVRSSTGFDRYVGEAEATQHVLDGGWLHTGDRARFLASGELVLLGRVQAMMSAPDGTRVDTGDIASALRASFACATYVFAPVPDGAFLYVALPRTEGAERAARLELLAESDSRWLQFATELGTADPHRLVAGFALFEGVFDEGSGEMGPTGKPRSHRIHALHSKQARAITRPALKKLDHAPIHHSVVSHGVGDRDRLLH